MLNWILTLSDFDIVTDRTRWSNETIDKFVTDMSHTIRLCRDQHYLQMVRPRLGKLIITYGVTNPPVLVDGNNVWVYQGDGFQIMNYKHAQLILRVDDLDQKWEIAYKLLVILKYAYNQNVPLLSVLGDNLYFSDGLLQIPDIPHVVAVKIESLEISIDIGTKTLRQAIVELSKWFRENDLPDNARFD